MYEQETYASSDMPAKSVETLRLTSRIKDELFGLRDTLNPLIIGKEGLLGQDAKPAPVPPLIKELEDIVEIIQNLKRDIKI